jgi:hypothetical protein
MNWALALLWLVSGIILGIFGAVYALVLVFSSDIERRLFFKNCAEKFPEEVEAALRGNAILRPRDTLPDPIQFRTCAHCLMPWFVENGRLGRHPRFYENQHEACPGSGTQDFLDFE